MNPCPVLTMCGAVRRLECDVGVSCGGVGSRGCEQNGLKFWLQKSKAMPEIGCNAKIHATKALLDEGLRAAVTWHAAPDPCQACN